MSKKTLPPVSFLDGPPLRENTQQETTVVLSPMSPQLRLEEPPDQVLAAVRVVPSMDCPRLYAEATRHAQWSQRLQSPTTYRALLTATAARATPLRGAVRQRDH
jgi:hypothetical protein